MDSSSTGTASVPAGSDWIEQQLREADMNGLMKERMLRYFVWLMGQSVDVDMLEQYATGFRAVSANLLFVPFSILD